MPNHLIKLILMKKNTTSYSAFLVDNKLLFKYIMNTKGSLCDGETYIKFLIIIIVKIFQNEKKLEEIYKYYQLINLNIFNEKNRLFLTTYSDEIKSNSN